MSKSRHRFSAESKFEVALQAAKGLKTLNELSSQFGVHPNQISAWKRQLLASGPTVFSHTGARQQRTLEVLQMVQSLRAAWQLSSTLDGLFCRVALRQALQEGVPTIFNTDQGAQFTAVEFTGILETAGIQIGMDA